MVRWLRKIALTVCVMVVLLVLAGASYQASDTTRTEQSSEVRDQRFKYPPSP